jgi:hypothetical protein
MSWRKQVITGPWASFETASKFYLSNLLSGGIIVEELCN